MSQFTKFSLKRQDSTIPDGIHVARLVDAEEREGQSSGMPYIALTLEIEADADWDGQRVWANLSLSPKARFKVDEFLDAVQAPDEGEATIEKFLGLKMKIQVENKTYTTREGGTGEKAEVLKFLPLAFKEPLTSVAAKPDLQSLAKAKKGKKGPDIPEDVLDE